MSNRKPKHARTTLLAIAAWSALAIGLAACKTSAPAADAGGNGFVLDAAAPSPDAGDAALVLGPNPQRDAAAQPAHDAGPRGDAGAKPKPDAARPSMPANTSSQCQNGLRDGAETDIDCGGGQCGTCLSGRRCGNGGDCASGTCQSGSCTCLALSACPKDACGTIRNCGSELSCGGCASGVCYENHCCTPRTCASGECGVFADGCGGTIRCGDASCCTPRTCEHPSLDQRCGTFDDRCGGSVSCACADSHASCYLGECCTASECDGEHCGVSTPNGCGGVMSCSCKDGKTCYRGACCEPLGCSNWNGPGCVAMPDGCGGTTTCGCTKDQSCQEGSCCDKVSCGSGAIGDLCGTAISDGCSGTQSCSCDTGLGCYLGRCCAVQTCTQQQLDHRCGPATNGCGVSGQWCGCAQQNGMRVERRAACGNSCENTLAKVATCDATAAIEVLNQTAGWDFASSVSSSACNASFAFTPNWTNCASSGGFSVDARGFIVLGAGTHCFSISGNNSCGSLYFVSSPATFTGWDALPSSTAATVSTGDTPVCVQLEATDYYPIRWLYTQSGGLASFHVNYCAGSASSCVPLSSAMLYPALD